jgi:hypothetical protein
VDGRIVEKMWREVLTKIGNLLIAILCSLKTIISVKKVLVCCEKRLLAELLSAFILLHKEVKTIANP